MKNKILRRVLQWGVIVLFLGISISLVVAEIITTITKAMSDKFLVCFYILLGLEILLAHICLIISKQQKKTFYFIFGYYVFFSIMAITVMVHPVKALYHITVDVPGADTVFYYIKEINIGVLMILALHYGYWALVMAKNYKKSPSSSIIWKNKRW